MNLIDVTGPATELINRAEQQEQNDLAFEEAEHMHRQRWARFKRMIPLPAPRPKKYPQSDLFGQRQYSLQTNYLEDTIKRMEVVVSRKKPLVKPRDLARERKKKAEN